MINKGIILILLLSLTACKTRQVAITDTDVTTHINLSKTSIAATLKTDTTTTHIDNKISNKIHTDDEIEILPDSGSIQNITIKKGENFTFSGKAKQINYKHHTTDSSVADQSLQTNKQQTIKSTTADSIVQNQTTHTISKTKKVDSKFNFYWLEAGLVLIILCYIAYRIFF